MLTPLIRSGYFLSSDRIDGLTQALISTEIERSDSARRDAELLDKDHDRKVITLDALQFDPGFLPSVSCIHPLADDAFVDKG